MKKMYILGAGGLAREIYSYLKATSFQYDGYELAGFLTDFEDDLSDYKFEHGIKGPIKLSQLEDNAALIMGISDCSFKEELYNYYKGLGCKFLTYTHPSSVIGSDVILGEGSLFGPNSVVTVNSTIGKCVTVNAMATIGHDAVLGDFCTLSGHCDITGGVTLGEKVFLGSHACVIPKVVVEPNAVIGAGSVVISKVKTGTTVFGNPAKKIM